MNFPTIFHDFHTDWPLIWLSWSGSPGSSSQLATKFFISLCRIKTGNPAFDLAMNSLVHRFGVNFPGPNVLLLWGVCFRTNRYWDNLVLTAIIPINSVCFLVEILKRRANYCSNIFFHTHPKFLRFSENCDNTFIFFPVETKKYP